MSENREWKITDMAYISLATPNIEQTIAHFRRVFGMDETSDFSAHRLYGWLRMVMGNGPECYQELLQPTNEQLPLGRFVQNHGAGIYVASYVVDDVAACYRDLTAKGVRFMTAPNVTRAERAHAMWVHPRATTGVYIEFTDHLLWRAIKSSAEPPGGERTEAIIRNVSHVAAVVKDLDAATALYRHALNLDVINEPFSDDVGTYRGVILGQGGRGYIELLQPTDGNSPIGRFLASRGEGPYFASFVADNVQLAVDTIKSRGGNASMDPDGRTGWVHPSTGHGEMMRLAPEYALGN